jgi:hypothetical protein
LRRHTASSRSKEVESHFVSQCLILPRSVRSVTVFDLLEYCRDSKVVSLAELQGIAPKSLLAFSRIKGKTQSFPTGPSFIWYGNIKGKQCIYFSHSNQPPATRNTESHRRNNVTSGAYTLCFSNNDHSSFHLSATSSTTFRLKIGSKRLTESISGFCFIQRRHTHYLGLKNSGAP